MRILPLSPLWTVWLAGLLYPVSPQVGLHMRGIACHDPVCWKYQSKYQSIWPAEWRQAMNCTLWCSPTTVWSLGNMLHCYTYAATGWVDCVTVVWKFAHSLFVSLSNACKEFSPSSVGFLNVKFIIIEICSAIWKSFALAGTGEMLTSDMLLSMGFRFSYKCTFFTSTCDLG